MRIKKTFYAAIIVSSFILFGAGCSQTLVTPSEPTTVEVSFRLEKKEGDSEAPVSDVYLVTKGLLGADVTDRGHRMGSGQGCKVSPSDEFEFKGESVAEVYCYFAGAGDLFQAKANAAGDIEVVRYDVTEATDVDSLTYSIEFLNPESVYTFDLEAGISVAQPK